MGTSGNNSTEDDKGGTAEDSAGGKTTDTKESVIANKASSAQLENETLLKANVTENTSPLTEDEYFDKG